MHPCRSLATNWGVCGLGVLHGPRDPEPKDFGRGKRRQKANLVAGSSNLMEMRRGYCRNKGGKTAKHLETAGFEEKKAKAFRRRRWAGGLP